MPTRPDQRLNFRQRGYTPEWDKLSRDHRRQHPLCLGCEAMGLVEVATQVDHIVPHQGNRDLLLDTANLQSCCDWHHNAVKQKLEQLWFEGSITIAELRIDSPKAIRIARHTPRKAFAIGADGW